MAVTTRKIQAIAAPKAVNSIGSIGPAFMGAKDAVESLFGMSAAVKVGETAAALGKGNLNAVLEAGNALVAGAQEIGQMWLALVQGAVGDGIGATRRLAACRTTKDVIDAQGEIARASYEKFASESRKLSEISHKIAGNVSAPIAAQIGATAETLAKPVAA